MNMRKTLLVIAACMLSFHIATAQEKPQVKRTDPQTSDLFKVLETMDVYMYRFDLRDFLNEKYNITAYIDEYEPGKEPKRIYNANLGDNIRSLSEVSEQYREDFRKEKQVPEGKDEWESIKEMSVYITKQNDSIGVLTIYIPEGLTASRRLSLRQVESEGFKTYLYRPRPFKFNETGIEEGQETPLVLYASAWVDEIYKVMRFCGEKEIDPEMQAKILTHVPHYYIFGLKFQKVKAEE